MNETLRNKTGRASVHRLRQQSDSSESLSAGVSHADFSIGSVAPP